MAKKIIQIATTSDADGDPYVFALCDDGSLYKGNVWSDDSDWMKIAAIPDDDVTTTESADA